MPKIKHKDTLLELHKWIESMENATKMTMYSEESPVETTLRIYNRKLTYYGLDPVATSIHETTPQIKELVIINNYLRNLRPYGNTTPVQKPENDVFVRAFTTFHSILVHQYAHVSEITHMTPDTKKHFENQIDHIKFYVERFKQPDDWVEKLPDYA